MRKHTTRHTQHRFAACPCLQPGGALADVCCLCADCCRDLGKLGLSIAVLGSACVGVAGIVAAAHLDTAAHFFWTFVLVKGLAWLFEIAAGGGVVLGGRFRESARNTPRSSASDNNQVLGFTFYRRREKQRTFWQGGRAGGPRHPARK